MKKAIINVLLVFFLGVLLYSGYQLYGIFSEYYKGRSEYKKTSDQYVTKKDSSSEDGEGEEYETAPIEVDFSSLMKENEDIAGWIYCPDTVIDYPDTIARHLHTVSLCKKNLQYASIPAFFCIKIQYKSTALLCDMNFQR